MEYIEIVPEIAASDVKTLERKDAEYGGSWLKRGGVGAFMMLARKWDRLENHVAKKGWDVLDAIAEDRRQESVLDDIRDLRAYLLLVEAEALRRMRSRITDDVHEAQK